MKKAVMYGAGNIGRGFIGQLFAESGYEVVFIDVNQEIIARLNQDGQYPVRVLTGTDTRETVVANVRGVNGREIEKVAAEIATADIMATAVGVNVLPHIAKPLAAGLQKRWQSGGTEPLNIIICENLSDASSYLAKLIKQELDEAGQRLFEEKVGLVEAAIGRMVPIMTPQMQEGNVLRICVEEFCELPVDRDGFKGAIPPIKNMQPASTFSFYVRRKLFIHNMGHAVTAYLGKLKGYRYIWEAIRDPLIKETVSRAMQDSAGALAREYGIKLETILAHCADLIKRFGNRQLGDTIDRVGNDPPRKLAPHDRLVGAANLCVQHGIRPVSICLGIAAAMKFSSAQNTTGNAVQDLVTREGPRAVLKEICHLTEEDPIWDIILDFYQQMDRGLAIDELLKTAGD